MKCPQCHGRGWYADGPTDKPEQIQCADCYGTGDIGHPYTNKFGIINLPSNELTAEEVEIIAAGPIAKMEDAYQAELKKPAYESEQTQVA